MLLAGTAILKRGIVRNLLSVHQQVQPCGIDVSLRQVLQWTSRPVIDFDNSRRQSASTSKLPFRLYLVEFNETVHIPLDCMGPLFVRSSLWRSGVLLTAGVIDAGYEGVLGALLDVKNPHGISLCKNAKLGQVTVHKLEEKVAGYNGIYQSSQSTVGRDGPAASTPNQTT
ncbi:dUTPase-like protein [Canariomyces notabilis]|uniref:dUTPase-like protein n=1 Tax=Canariomyces notabilis TaxID=2074819 RepID=A0AAN6QML1_9PEZI|nr:dUTPase-like protein [Canariomyces arenarius]